MDRMIEVTVAGAIGGAGLFLLLFSIALAIKLYRWVDAQYIHPIPTVRRLGDE